MRIYFSHGKFSDDEGEPIYVRDHWWEVLCFWVPRDNIGDLSLPRSYSKIRTGLYSERDTILYARTGTAWAFNLFDSARHGWFRLACRAKHAGLIDVGEGERISCYWPIMILRS